MANFTGQTVTNAGRNLLGRVLAGEGKLVFTKAAFGDQKHSGSLKNIRDLKHKKLDLKVMNIRNDSGTAVLTVYMSNENVEEGFRTEEFGVYAKIDTDDEEILYSYCVAIEADFFPNNRLGHTYENVTDVYMAIANDVDADIHVKDGVVFLTKRIADENYIKYGVQAVGELEGRTSLEENKRYSSKGEWYLNIGGNRSWDKSPTPDENLIHMTWDWLFKNKEPIFKKKSGFNLEKTDSYEEDDTNKVATGRALKSLYDWIRNKLASFTLSWDRITNKPNLTTTENLTQLLKGKENTFSKNSGFNKEKTDEYKVGTDTDKVFTQKGANSLYKEIESEISNKVSKDGDTINGGDLSFTNYNTGIKVGVAGYNTGKFLPNSQDNMLRGGIDYCGLDKSNNVDIVTWNGFSVTSSYTDNLGDTVFSINARNGSVYVKDIVRAKNYTFNDTDILTTAKDIKGAINEIVTNGIVSNSSSGVISNNYNADTYNKAGFYVTSPESSSIFPKKQATMIHTQWTGDKYLSLQIYCPTYTNELWYRCRTGGSGGDMFQDSRRILTDIDNKIMNCSGYFPLTRWEQDKIYLFRNTGNYYRCKASGSGSLSAPDSNFELVNAITGKLKINSSLKENYYRNGQTIPEWGKHKFARLTLCISDNFNRGVTDIQIQLSTIYSELAKYNDNGTRLGSFAFNILDDGIVRFNGTASGFVNNSFIRDVTYFDDI